MSSKKNICIVGATGAVGVHMLLSLEKRDFPVASIKLFASERSVGKVFKFRGEDITLSLLNENSFKGMDIALFSASSAISKKYARYAIDAGCAVVDNSSAFRMDKDTPLVIPEINSETLKTHNGIIANPNCSTIILLMGIYPIHRLSPVKRIICSTYQSASGAGARAMEELKEQARATLDNANIKKEIFPYQIAFNLFSHDSDILDNGYNVEEMKMVNEVGKILGRDDIKIGVTCVRVPIMRSHSESVNLELEERLDIDKIREAIRAFSGVTLVDDRKSNHFPMPIEASDIDNVLVGRIRYDLSIDNGIALFIAGDQLLKGAALNAVQIAELL